MTDDADQSAPVFVTGTACSIIYAPDRGAQELHVQVNTWAEHKGERLEVVGTIIVRDRAAAEQLAAGIMSPFPVAPQPGPAKIQAKDIPDERFLGVVRAVVDAGYGRANWRDFLGAFPDVPHRVLVAKARKLIRRGLLDGCACGCRGDFEIPTAPVAP